MEDIIERLRDEKNIHFAEVHLCKEAADEIERLRRRIADLEEFLRGAALQFQAMSK